MSEREKTYVEDVNRSIYDIRNEERTIYRIKKGLDSRYCGGDFREKKGSRMDGKFQITVSADL